MAVIILEGPDCSGKTTLADALIKAFGREKGGVLYLHHTYEPDFTGDQLFTMYNRWLREGDRHNVIIDRLFRTEDIYGEVVREGSRLNEGQRAYLLDYCKKQQVIQVICLPPWEVVCDHWVPRAMQKWDPKAKTGEYVKKLDQIQKIWERFADELENSEEQNSGSLLHYDWTRKESLAWPAFELKGMVDFVKLVAESRKPKFPV